MIEDVDNRLWKGADEAVGTDRLAFGSLPDRLPVPVAIALISVMSVLLWGMVIMAGRLLGQL